ncbi:hypothetical protein BST97_09790 [Nonlabens spongiae]|uniref:NAD(P)-binding domain-containing protein n=1 Tax=Nonlabens spongiae TaxID=331648 RepID=A0A1W6MKW8_9FLAO|nr:NAD(P)H-binding protein [Nonlabens spongiae]ARN78258.1 hypothetical protein BST97_09790 [Nonlabens spongiae]
MTKKIGILGCGWLGKALGSKLVNSGFSVKGTVRKKEDFAQLEKLNIQPYQVELTPDKINGEIDGFLNGLNQLVFSLPPGTRKNPEYNFSGSINLLMDAIKPYGLNRILFVSSTSVFEGREGNPKYDENSIPNCSSASAQQLIQAENIIQKSGFQSIILRSGGQIGQDRHPVKYLAGRKGLSNPDAPVNLVSQDYLIELMTKLISAKNPPKIIHAISEPHESRKDYYSRIARERNLEIPEFDGSRGNAGKKIVSKYSNY